jgi:hypothetical protein
MPGLSIWQWPHGWLWTKQTQGRQDPNASILSSTTGNHSWLSMFGAAYYLDYQNRRADFLTFVDNGLTGFLNSQPRWLRSPSMNFRQLAGGRVLAGRRSFGPPGTHIFCGHHHCFFVLQGFPPDFRGSHPAEAGGPLNCPVLSTMKTHSLQLMPVHSYINRIGAIN